MAKEVLIEEITSIISRTLNIELNNQSTMSNTKEWDSMMQMQIMIKLEKAFNIEFDLMNLSDAVSVEGWYNAVKKECCNK